MWNEHLKMILNKLGVTYEEAARQIGMKKDGFQDSINNGTIQFKRMIVLADKYDFSLDELRYSEDKVKAEKASAKNKLLENYHSSSCEIIKSTQIYEDIKTNYESHIETLREQNETLKSQINFLQEIIRKDCNKSGEAISNSA